MSEVGSVGTGAGGWGEEFEVRGARESEVGGGCEGGGERVGECGGKEGGDEEEKAGKVGWYIHALMSSRFELLHIPTFWEGAILIPLPSLENYLHR